jgi:prevent-host-death family protein
MKTWQATKAKQHFSQIIDAVKVAPQLVVRRGEPVGVIVSYQDYLNSKTLQEKKSLGKWLHDLKSINETEEDMPDLERVDREQTSWE